MQPRCQLLSGWLASPRIAFRAPQSTQRTYATSTPAPAVKNPLPRRRGGDLGSHLPKHVIPKDLYIPPYPHGDHALFKQANRGLYGEQMIQFGNNVSPETETKTRRKWKPNVLSKSLYSVALKKKIKLRITAKVLKTMDREGGLDEYLLKDNEHRVKELGPLGWALRCTLIQKPEVIARLRAEAAALGLDQATINKQWPIRQMLVEQKTTQNDLVRATDLVEEENEEYNEAVGEQELGAEGEEGDSPMSLTLTKPEQRVMREAKLEYAKAIKAAQRYLSRGIVDSEEEGLKLAFVRAKERHEAASRLKQNFTKKIDQQFSPEHLQEVRARFGLESSAPDHAVKKIAYNQWRRQQIDEAGSYEAWRQSVEAGNAARRAVQVEEAGGQEAWDANRKNIYTHMIAEAETASTNMLLDAERRMYLENAICKADRAIKAKASGGQDTYIESALEELRRSRPSQSVNLRELMSGSRQGKEAGGDAWAALVNSSNRPAENRPNT